MNMIARWSFSKPGVIGVFEVLVAVDAVGTHKTGIWCSVKTCSNISDAA